MRPNPTQTLQTIHTTIRGYTPSTLHNRTAFRKLNRDLDRLVRSIGGRKWLHSRNFYSEEEFWNNYPRKEEYALLRSKCGAEYLHTVFEKTKTDEKRMKNAVRVEGFWARVFYWGSVVGSRGEEEVRDNGKGKGKGKEKEKAGEN